MALSEINVLESSCSMSCQIPLNLPCSVTLQPGPEDTGKVSMGSFLFSTGVEPVASGQ